jgi:transposase
VRSLLELIDVLDDHEARFAGLIAERLKAHRGDHAIQQLPGIGPRLAAVLVAEIGDVHRFTGPASLCSWAGLTPRHRESDTVVHRGHITNQGSTLVGWAAIEAVQRQQTTAKISADNDRIEARRAKNISRSPRHANCSHCSTTGCATATSARLTGPGRRERSGRNPCPAAALSDPLPGVVANLIDPAGCYRTAPCPRSWAKR